MHAIQRHITGRHLVRVAALILMGACFAQAQDASADRTESEVVIQFDRAISDALFDFLSADPDAALDMLDRELGFASTPWLDVSPVFTVPVQPSEARSVAFQRHVDGLRRRFASRMLRPGAQQPHLDEFYRLRLRPAVSVDEIVAALEDSPIVTSISVNRRMEAYADPLPAVSYIPDDPYITSDGSTWIEGSMGQVGYPDLWGHRRVQVLEAWDTMIDAENGPGAGIVVAVIDSGLDTSHPDIAPNLWINSGEVPGNSVDDDGNGFVDDDKGWDFFNVDNDPVDDHGHGTHVAGTVGAAGNNGSSIVGMAPNVELMAVKVLNSFGGGTSDGLAAGLTYAADNGAHVINASIGCAFPCPSDPVVEAAVLHAHSLGAVVVFAAGNSTDDVASYSPQNMTETITVSAVDRSDTSSDFSNFGTLLDVAAPGGGPTTDCPDWDLLSLRAALNNITCFGQSLDVGPAELRLAGTSMAAPHVAGIAALILGKNATLSNEEVRQILRSSADDLGPAGFDSAYGYGRVNALQAVLATPQGPCDQDPTTIWVPCDYPTIGQAIAASQSGDTILVSDGVYDGVENRSLLVFKSITLQSVNGPENCIIDGENLNHVFHVFGHDVDATIEGFTIRRGLADLTQGTASSTGGGISCILTGTSSLRLSQCIVEDCWSRESGGGMFAKTDLILEKCTFRNNTTAQSNGAGLAISVTGDELVTVADSNFVDNNAWGSGGGISVTAGAQGTGSGATRVEIWNSTIAGNTANTGGFSGVQGGGIHAVANGAGNTIDIQNCILWGNLAVAEPKGHELLVGGLTPSNVNVWYSDVQGSTRGVTGIPTWGPGNLDVDPLFADALSGDYHLDKLSPCLNSGNPNYSLLPGETDIDCQNRIKQNRIDMGSDERRSGYVQIPPVNKP